MAFRLQGLSPDALDFLGSLAAPVRWFCSSSFRARTRKRRDHGGRRLRIGEVGVRAMAWLLVFVVVLILLAQLLFGTAHA
jgi:hypothetical protein